MVSMDAASGVAAAGAAAGAVLRLHGALHRAADLLLQARQRRRGVAAQVDLGPGLRGDGVDAGAAADARHRHRRAGGRRRLHRADGDHRGAERLHRVGRAAVGPGVAAGAAHRRPAAAASRWRGARCGPSPSRPATGRRRPRAAASPRGRGASRRAGRRSPPRPRWRPAAAGAAVRMRASASTRATASRAASPRVLSVIPGAYTRSPSWRGVRSVPAGKTVSRCADTTTGGAAGSAAPGRSASTLPTSSVRTSSSPSSVEAGRAPGRRAPPPRTRARGRAPAPPARAACPRPSRGCVRARGRRRGVRAGRSAPWAPLRGPFGERNHARGPAACQSHGRGICGLARSQGHKRLFRVVKYPVSQPQGTWVCYGRSTAVGCLQPPLHGHFRHGRVASGARRCPPSTEPMRIECSSAT